MRARTRLEVQVGLLERRQQSHGELFSELLELVVANSEMNLLVDVVVTDQQLVILRL